MRKILPFLIIATYSLIALPFSTEAKSEIRIFVDEVEQHYDEPVVMQEDRTYLPIRYIAEQTGSNVNWDAYNKSVNIFKNGDRINFKIGETVANVNGTEKEIPQSFISGNSRTMIPIRFVSEQLGLEVRWDQENHHIYIEAPKPVEVENVVEVEPAEHFKKAIPINVQLTADQQNLANQLMQDTERLARMEKMIEQGTTFLGTPYQFGAKVGETESFDCSSYIAYLLGEQGIMFPRTASDQSQEGMKIPRDEIKRGDLLFFDTALNGNIEHVGIYLGDNQMLHVSTSRGVQITEFFDYWQDRYVVATRF